MLISVRSLLLSMLFVSTLSSAYGQVIVSVGQLPDPPDNCGMFIAQCPPDPIPQSEDPDLDGIGFPAQVTGNVFIPALDNWALISVQAFFEDEQTTPGNQIQGTGTPRYRNVAADIPPGVLAPWGFEASTFALGNNNGDFPTDVTICVTYLLDGCGGNNNSDGNTCRICFNFSEGNDGGVAIGSGSAVIPPGLGYGNGSSPFFIAVTAIPDAPGRANLEFGVSYKFHDGTTPISAQAFTLLYEAEADGGLGDDIWVEADMGFQTGPLAVDPPYSEYEFLGTGVGTLFEVECDSSIKDAEPVFVFEPAVAVVVEYMTFGGVVTRDCLLFSRTGFRQCIIRDVTDVNDSRVTAALYDGCGNPWKCIQGGGGGGGDTDGGDVDGAMITSTIGSMEGTIGSTIGSTNGVIGSTIGSTIGATGLTIGSVIGSTSAVIGSTIGSTNAAIGSVIGSTIGSAIGSAKSFKSFSPISTTGSTISSTIGSTLGSTIGSTIGSNEPGVFSTTTFEGSTSGSFDSFPINGTMFDGGGGFEGGVVNPSAITCELWSGPGPIPASIGTDCSNEPCPSGFWVCEDTTGDGVDDSCTYYFKDCDGNVFECPDGDNCVLFITADIFE